MPRIKWMAGGAALVALALSSAVTAQENNRSSPSYANEIVYVDANTQSHSEERVRVQTIEKGDSSRSKKREAINAIPLNQLTHEHRKLADSVLRDISLYRRLPVVQCQTDPRVLRFFTEHPDVAVSIWRAMDISEFKMKQVGPDTYESDSGDGSVGTVTVILHTPTEQMLHCSGMFKSPVLPKPIQADALMFLHTDYTRDQQGNVIAQCRSDVFVSFSSNAVGAAARLIAPVSHNIADRNFEEVATFIRMMHIAMTEQPAWVEQIACKLEDVAADRPQRLVNLSTDIFNTAHPGVQRAPLQLQALSSTPEGSRTSTPTPSSGARPGAYGLTRPEASAAVPGGALR